MFLLFTCRRVRDDYTNLRTEHCHLQVCLSVALTGIPTLGGLQVTTMTHFGRVPQSHSLSNFLERAA